MEIKIYMKHCGCQGENILTFDVALLMISVTFLKVCCHSFEHKAVFVSVLAYEDSGKKGHGSQKSDKLLKRGFKNWEER